MNKPIIGLIIVAAALLVLTVGAFGQDVRYNFMPGTDFSKYRTYKWVRIENARYPNQLLNDQIMRSIDQQLSLKGLAKADDAPDLVVTYQVAVDKETEWNSYSTGGGGWGWGGWGGWGGQSTSTYSTTINVGSLDLDFYDMGTKKQVWRGEATKTVKSQKDPAKLQKNLDKAMAKLLKNYPPPPKK